jgi:predicted nucleic acid-binding protein
MTIAFLDTSAFLKLYLAEKGSTWLKTFVTYKQIVISQLVLIECATTLGRLYRDGVYTKRLASFEYSKISRERSKYEIIQLGSDEQVNKVVSMAFNISPTLRIRALDSIHLATAKIALDAANRLVPPEPFVFLSSDVQLLKVAQAQGFVTENPEAYP